MDMMTRLIMARMMSTINRLMLMIMRMMTMRLVMIMIMRMLLRTVSHVANGENDEDGVKVGHDNDENDEGDVEVSHDDYEDDEDDVEVGHVTNGECNSALMGGPSFTPSGMLGKEGWR